MGQFLSLGLSEERTIPQGRNAVRCWGGQLWTSEGVPKVQSLGLCWHTFQGAIFCLSPYPRRRPRGQSTNLDTTETREMNRKIKETQSRIVD